MRDAPAVRAAALLVDGADERERDALETLAQAAGFWTRRARTVAEAAALLDGVDLCIVRSDLAERESLIGLASGKQVLIVGPREPERAGGADVMWVEADEESVGDTLRQLRRVAAAERRVAALREALIGHDRFDLLVGRTDETHRLWKRVLACADDEQPLLVIGPSGSGKQAIARTLHRVGRRADGPLVRVDCATPSALGSLAAAAEEARGGTLLLAHADAAAYAEDGLAKLWSAPAHGAPRVVATVVRPPSDASCSLFDAHRLEISPLSARPDDVVALAEHFLQEHSRTLGVRKRWSSAALARLARHDWPGNVRELQQVVGRAALHASEDLDVGALALPSDGEPGEPDSFEVRVGSTIQAVERRLILATLAACRGNKPHAARILGISLKTLYNRLSVYRGSTSFDADPR